MPKDIKLLNTSSIQTKVALTIPPNSPQKLLSKKRKNTDSLIWLQEACNTAQGETALWVAVITQAMMDALSRCKKSESIYQKHEAIRWLTGNSKDFVDVCISAEMNPDYVRSKAKKVLSAPIPWRAEAGKGKRYQERKKYREKQRLEAKKSKQKEVLPPVIISLNFSHK